MRDVAILGCGPAGLLAAHAVEQAGLCPVIYSIPNKSHLHGAQFLHEFIPGASRDEDAMSIEFRKVGTPEGYATKVYGRPDAPCSWSSFPRGNVRAWSLAALYDRLWERYRGDVVPGEITGRLLDGIEQRYDLMFSSVPAPALCSEFHEFRSARVWIRHIHGGGDDLNFIEYNGDPTAAYYRTSRINGHWSTEFGHQVPMGKIGNKPLSTDCDCRPHFHRIGRFGQWKKGVLVNHAYRDAVEVLSAL